MKYIKYRRFLPLAALLIGLLGLLLRSAEHASFDLISGLAVESPMHTLFAIFLLVSAGLALLLAWPGRAAAAQGTIAQHFYTTKRLVTVGMLAGPILVILYGVILLNLSFLGGVMISGVLLALLAIFSGVCLFLLALACRRKQKIHGLVTLPVLCFLALLLVITYRTEGRNPVLLTYYLSILAQASWLMQFYFLAEFSYPPVRSRGYRFCAMLSIIWGVTALADVGNFPTLLQNLGFILISMSFFQAYLESEVRGFRFPEEKKEPDAEPQP